MPLPLKGSLESPKPVSHAVKALRPIDDNGRIGVEANIMEELPREIEGRQVVETPGICGGSPRIYGTRLPVWGLERARRKGWSDLDLLENYPSLTQADLEMAWNYVAAHLEQIEREIAENNGQP